MKTENRFLKSVQKFIFEFVIVTLGILAAFSINKWDANVKENEEERKSYQSVRNDLNTDLYVLNYYKEFHLNAIKYVTPMLSGELPSVDSLKYYLESSFAFQKGNATYVNLKYSGKLEILKNSEIKNKMLLYYETYYQGLESLSDNHQRLVSNQIKPFMITNLPYNFDEKEVGNLLQDGTFLNLVASQLEFLQTNLYAFERNETLIKSLLELLEEELGTQKTPRGIDTADAE